MVQLRGLVQVTNLTKGSSSPHIGLLRIYYSQGQWHIAVRFLHSAKDDYAWPIQQIGTSAFKHGECAISFKQSCDVVTVRNIDTKMVPLFKAKLERIRMSDYNPASATKRCRLDNSSTSEEEEDEEEPMDERNHCYEVEDYSDDNYYSEEDDSEAVLQGLVQVSSLSHNSRYKQGFLSLNHKNGKHQIQVRYQYEYRNTYKWPVDQVFSSTFTHNECMISFKQCGDVLTVTDFDYMMASRFKDLLESSINESANNQSNQSASLHKNSLINAEKKSVRSQNVDSVSTFSETEANSAHLQFGRKNVKTQNSHCTTPCSDTALNRHQPQPEKKSVKVQNAAECTTMYHNTRENRTPPQSERRKLLTSTQSAEWATVHNNTVENSVNTHATESNTAVENSAPAASNRSDVNTEISEHVGIHKNTVWAKAQLQLGRKNIDIHETDDAAVHNNRPQPVEHESKDGQKKHISDALVSLEESVDASSTTDRSKSTIELPGLIGVYSKKGGSSTAKDGVVHLDTAHQLAISIQFAQPSSDHFSWPISSIWEITCRAQICNITLTNGDMVYLKDYDISKGLAFKEIADNARKSSGQEGAFEPEMCQEIESSVTSGRRKSRISIMHSDNSDEENSSDSEWIASQNNTCRPDQNSQPTENRNQIDLNGKIKVASLSLGNVPFQEGVLRLDESDPPTVRVCYVDQSHEAFIWQVKSIRCISCGTFACLITFVTSDIIAIKEYDEARWHSLEQRLKEFQTDLNKSLSPEACTARTHHEEDMDVTPEPSNQGTTGSGSHSSYDFRATAKLQVTSESQGKKPLQAGTIHLVDTGYNHWRIAVSYPEELSNQYNWQVKSIKSVVCKPSGCRIHFHNGDWITMLDKDISKGQQLKEKVDKIQAEIQEELGRNPPQHTSRIADRCHNLFESGVYNGLDIEGFVSQNSCLLPETENACPGIELEGRVKVEGPDREYRRSRSGSVRIINTSNKWQVSVRLAHKTRDLYTRPVRDISEVRCWNRKCTISFGAEVNEDMIILREYDITKGPLFEDFIGNIQREEAESVNGRATKEDPSEPVVPVNELREMLLCAICLEDVQEPRVLQCQHSFCCPCLETMKCLPGKPKVVCPNCRMVTEVPGGSVHNLPRDLKLLQLAELIKGTH